MSDRPNLDTDFVNDMLKDLGVTFCEQCEYFVTVDGSSQPFSMCIRWSETPHMTYPDDYCSRAVKAERHDESLTGKAALDVFGGVGAIRSVN